MVSTIDSGDRKSVWVVVSQVIKGALEDEDPMYDHIKDQSSYFLRCQTKCRVCKLDIDAQDIDEQFPNKHPENQAVTHPITNIMFWCLTSDCC